MFRSEVEKINKASKKRGCSNKAIRENYEVVSSSCKEEKKDGKGSILKQTLKESVVMQIEAIGVVIEGDEGER